MYEGRILGISSYPFARSDHCGHVNRSHTHPNGSVDTQKYMGTWHCNNLVGIAKLVESSEGLVQHHAYLECSLCGAIVRRKRFSAHRCAAPGIKKNSRTDDQVKNHSLRLKRRHEQADPESRKEQMQKVRSFKQPGKQSKDAAVPTVDEI